MREDTQAIPKSLSPYEVIEAHGNRTVTINRSETFETVSADGVEIVYDGSVKNEESNSNMDSEMPKEPEKIDKKLTEGIEYVLEPIDDHLDSVEGTEFLVKWYGFRAKDRTWEPM